MLEKVKSRLHVRGKCCASCVFSSSFFFSSFFEHSSKKQVNRSAKLRRIHLDREYWKRTNGRRFQDISRTKEACIFRVVQLEI